MNSNNKSIKHHLTFRKSKIAFSKNNILPTTSTNNYDLFGMQMPGRSYNPGDYSFGFNGKLKDNEIKGEGNSYDYGQRLLDVRLGRWLTTDNREAFYSSISPYTFALNTPIRAIDPDGDVVIYINGEVGTFVGRGGNSQNSDRGNKSYWTSSIPSFVRSINAGFGEFESNSKFVDGDLSLASSMRHDLGILQAKADFADIIKNLQKDKNGKIVETIKIVSHSKGTATANGYIEGLRALIEQNKELFSDPSNVLEAHLSLAPHQSWTMTVPESNMTTLSITHGGDWLSDDNMKGDVTNLTTQTSIGKSIGSLFTLQSHAVSTFYNEAVGAAKGLHKGFLNRTAPVSTGSKSAPETFRNVRNL